MARVISITSVGERTGKTTVALNLGLLLSKNNRRVLVIDLDFTKKNMLEHLDLHNLPITVQHVIEGNNHINDSVYVHSSGLRIIPSVIHPTTEYYAKFAYHFENLLADYDYILLDLPSNIHLIRDLMPQINEAIIVQDAYMSSKFVRDALDLVLENKILPLGIVLNKSREDSVDAIFNYPVLVKIPHHVHIEKSFELKDPVVHIYPKSDASKKFELLAKMLEQ